MRKLIREPLLHFLLIGLTLFLLFNFESGRRGGADRRIVVTDATVAGLIKRHESAWQRPPTPEELRGLIDSYVRDEMYYREGTRLGLDKDDPIVRRRVVQKLGVISEESIAVAAPGDAELETYLKVHADRYAQPARFSFEQVMFDPGRRGDRLGADLATALGRLNAGADAAAFGEATLLPASVEAIDAGRLARDFGDEFVAALRELPVGRWAGPVTSAYGEHLVRVTHRMPGRAPTLAEARSAVARDWENDRRQKAIAEFDSQLRQTYDVVIATEAPSPARTQGNQ